MTNWITGSDLAIGVVVVWALGFIAGNRLGRYNAMRENAVATQQEAEELIRRTIRTLWQGKVPRRAPHWRILRGGRRRLP